MWAGITRIAESLDRIIIQGKAHSNSFSLSLSLSSLSFLLCPYTLDSRLLNFEPQNFTSVTSYFLSSD
jgi:hypothetical protein